MTQYKMTYVHSFLWHLLSDQTTVVSIVAVGAAIIYLLRPFYDVTAAVGAKDFDFLAMHSVQNAEKDSSWQCEKVRRTDIQTVAAPTSRRWMHGPMRMRRNWNVELYLFTFLLPEPVTSTLTRETKGRRQNRITTSMWRPCQDGNG